MQKATIDNEYCLFRWTFFKIIILRWKHKNWSVVKAPIYFKSFIPSVYQEVTTRQGHKITHVIAKQDQKIITDLIRNQS